MSVSRYALIDQANIVQNVVLWDGTTGYTLPSGWRAVAAGTLRVGDTVDVNNNVTAPAVADPTFANQQTIQQHVVANEAALLAWIAANPNGAVLNGAQTLVLAKMLVGLCKLILADLSSTTGT